MPELQPGQASHEVKFGGPYIAELHRIKTNPLFGQHNMLIGDLLIDRIELRNIQPNFVLAHADRSDRLPVTEPAQIRDKGMSPRDLYCPACASVFGPSTAVPCTARLGTAKVCFEHLMPVDKDTVNKPFD
jgi:hypothetical protein